VQDLASPDSTCLVWLSLFTPFSGAAALLEISGLNGRWGPAVISTEFQAISQNVEKRLLSFVMRVSPHGTTRLPLGGFS